jgi:V8-like Glu-specific endopeptidase
MQLVIEYETFNGVTNVEKKLIDESGIVVESDLLNSEATLIITEVESNNAHSNADLISANYYGADDYEINGTITSVAADVDYYKFRSSVTGELTISGEWISGLPSSSEWHEDLYIVVENVYSTTCAASLLYNAGEANEMQKLTIDLKNGDYYIAVYANTDQGDRYVDESYSLDMSFVAASDAPLSISQTQSYPYNTVGYVTTQFDQTFRGTAFLVSAFTALTNGHNVYDTSANTWTNEFTLAPGQYISSVDELVYQPYGVKDAYEVVTNDGYRTSGETQYDYAAAHFATPFNDIQTFMPLEFNVAPSFINILGYPAMADGNLNSGMWQSYGNVVDLTDQLIMYHAFSYGGSSGSPVYTYNGETGLRRVVAVHGFGSNYFNGGIRFTSSNQALIEAWMQWEPDNNIYVNGRIDLEHYDNSLNGVVDLILSNLSNTYTAKTNTDGDFIIDAINSGTYTLTIEKNGYLTRTIDNIIINTESITLSSSLNPIVLKAGDVDGITGINADDLDYLISKLGLVDTDIDYVDFADFDKNNSIDAGDLAILIKNLDSVTSSYASWVW